MKSDMPRNKELPLFDPHMAAFTCRIEAEVIPPVDAQAEQWFFEARSLENPEIYVTDRDYKKIVQLTRQAAERHHWRAMLNLASLYIEGRDPTHGHEDAVQLVESAMRMGIPAAYDRMGTYYMNGIGVPADATKAYAFWQKAALLGNPQAMAHLGDKLRAVSDNIMPGYWANIPIAIRMLECSLTQGYGPAADNLHYLYLEPTSPDGQIIGGATPDTRLRALEVLHRGVKYGCSVCASNLSREFGRPFKPSEMIVPFIDKARSERYRVLARALEFNPDLRFPNLDKILPLPPAVIPTWNGDKKTLLDAAIGVSLQPRSNETSRPPQTKGVHVLDNAYRLHRTDGKTSESYAPYAGYWRPTAPGHTDEVQRQLLEVSPRLYAIGEKFDIPYYVNKRALISGSPMVWELWLTVDHDYPKFRLDAAPGLTRTVEHSETLLQCEADASCPVTGIWQPWIEPKHNMRGAVNQYWRQSWVLEGMPFPNPQRDWLLDLPANLITWHLLDSQGVDIDRDIEV